jgi:hypothetical protein
MPLFLISDRNANMVGAYLKQKGKRKYEDNCLERKTEGTTGAPLHFKTAPELSYEESVDQADSGWNTSDLYSGAAWFESLLGHRRS